MRGGMTVLLSFAFFVLFGADDRGSVTAEWPLSVAHPARVPIVFSSPPVRLSTPWRLWSLFRSASSCWGSIVARRRGPSGCGRPVIFCRMILSCVSPGVVIPQLFAVEQLDGTSGEDASGISDAAVNTKRVVEETPAGAAEDNTASTPATRTKRRVPGMGGRKRGWVVVDDAVVWVGTEEEGV